MPDRARAGLRGPWLWLALLALHGCAGTPTAAPPALPTAPAPPAARNAVAIERQWLQSWFEGTPVRIAQRSEASFSVEVPREFCFAPGRSEVKPALAAVLDKVAQSLARKPALRVQGLAAPGDSAQGTALAQQRAASVRKYLLARGVSSQQLAAASVTQVAAVQLRIGLDAP